MSTAAGSGQLEFVEIEHKYLVAEGFSSADFFATMRDLKPTKESELAVTDIYFVTKHQPQFVYRYRLDRELQHLTVKSLGRDNEQRVEVNLNLGLHAGDQSRAVHAFMSTLEILWTGKLEKAIHAFYFDDCEVVYYTASSGSQKINCVEFEALAKGSKQAALQTIHRYEQRAGFREEDRCKESLFGLLLVPQMPTALRNQYRQQ